MKKKVIYDKDFVIVYYDNYGPFYYNVDYWKTLQNLEEKHKEWIFQSLTTQT